MLPLRGRQSRMKYWFLSAPVSGDAGWRKIESGRLTTGSTAGHRFRSNRIRRIQLSPPTRFHHRRHHRCYWIAPVVTGSEARRSTLAFRLHRPARSAGFPHLPWVDVRGWDPSLVSRASGVLHGLFHSDTSRCAWLDSACEASFDPAVLVKPVHWP